MKFFSPEPPVAFNHIHRSDFPAPRAAGAPAERGGVDGETTTVVVPSRDFGLHALTPPP